MKQALALLASLLFLVLCIWFANNVKQQRLEKAKQEAAHSAVEHYKLEERKRILAISLQHSEAVVSTIQTRKALRTDSIRTSLAQDKSLQRLHEKTFSTPSRESARELELFFARYCDSATAAQSSEIPQK